MRPSILLVLVAAARIACARINFRGDIEELEPTPCMVRAWVRAADMNPNAVSHGELKIKIVQPCTDEVESVALRLGLDEMSELSNMANTTFDGGFGDFSGAIPSQAWTTTKHTRSAFQVEKTLSTDGSLKSANWIEGVIFPFTVISPNVNYPPAIFPLMFGDHNAQETQRSSFGRVYGYVASVKFMGESGQRRTAEAPAGFTSFRPYEPPKTTDYRPYQTSLKAVQTGSRWHAACREGSKSESTSADKAPATLNVTVTLPGGTALVQGDSFIVDVKLDDTVSTSANQYSASVMLVRHLTIHGVPAQDSYSDLDYRHRPFFQEIFADMARMDTYRADQKVGLGHSVRSHVGVTFPRTTTGAPEEVPFQIISTLVVTLDETFDVDQIDPVPSAQRPQRSGQRTTRRPVEKGWEFSECDSQQYHRRKYEAEIPVTIVSAQAEELAANPPIDYLANNGRVHVPRILSGHVSRALQYDFDIALPVVSRNTSTSAVASIRERDGVLVSGIPTHVDAKAGQYVGALWHRKVHAVEKAQLHDLGGDNVLDKTQAVLAALNKSSKVFAKYLE